MATTGDQAVSITGEKFGPEAPPLSVLIKDILDRYPDGQIFKVSLHSIRGGERCCDLINVTV